MYSAFSGPRNPKILSSTSSIYIYIYIYIYIFFNRRKKNRRGQISQNHDSDLFAQERTRNSNCNPVGQTDRQTDGYEFLQIRPYPTVHLSSFPRIYSHSCLYWLNFLHLRGTLLGGVPLRKITKLRGNGHKHLCAALYILRYTVYS